CEHISTHFHTPDDKLMMIGIHGCYNHHFRFCFRHHFVEIGKNRAVHTHVCFGQFESAGIDVTQTNKFHHVAVVIDHTFSPKADSADSGAYHGNSLFLLAGNCCPNRTGKQGSTCCNSCCC